MVRRIFSLATAVMVTILLLLTLSSGAHAKDVPGVLDLNTATVAELSRLPGIGKKRAMDIVRRRRTRPYKRTSELLRIRGIGRKTYYKVKPFVRVGPLPKEPPQTVNP